jgi:NAD(P)-dependent dehydrogenase (short-subunit alcohol dehydrogenase family)
VIAGKVCLVIGASRGIGAATARAFGAAGAKVVLAARDASALEEVARDIRATGAEAIAVPTDMGDEEQLAALIETTRSRFGRLDAAFNNAGSGHMPAPLADLTARDFDEAIRVNLRGTLLAMKHELTAMLPLGAGAIVNMSSTAGLQGVRGMSAYSAAKHAIVGATRSAALDYAARGIRINVVAPGPISTERLAALPPDRRELVARAVPMGRIGHAEEVASTVVWLCSDAASFVTGAVIPVDGGRLAGA